jgi:zinc transporter ZupT
VLGILSIVLLLVCGIGLLTAVAGLVVGFIALARRSNKGRAIVGLVLSGLTLLLGVIAFVWFLNTFQECLDQPTQAEVQSCVESKLGVQQPVAP